jgi:hypothetical protein
MRKAARSVLGFLMSATLAAALAVSLSAQNKNDKSKDTKASNDKPKLSLTARPAIAVAPARVVLTAELTGGANDFEEYYCPTVRWEWGDLSSSESGADCPPYEAGKTEIKRRFVIEHKFESSGAFKVYVRLKHGNKELVATSTTVKVQPGGRIEDPQ